jgi:ATP-dependent DNA helicase RecQ
VEQFGHERVSTFGIGKELSAMQWRAVIRQLIALRLLRVDYDRFNILQLTPDAREVLSGRRILKLRKPSEKVALQRRPKRGELTTSPARGALVGESDDVFQALREWRKGVAKEHSVPAYTVFHDATLLEIARLLPSSLQELSGISGIGTTKLERYGEPLLKVVRDRAIAT